jgi:hypothetical protein
VEHYWSYILFPFGILGMLAAGRDKPWGWLLPLFTQSLWAGFAIQTENYGFLPGTTAYAAVYALNYVNVKRRERGEEALLWKDVWYAARGKETDRRRWMKNRTNKKVIREQVDLLIKSDVMLDRMLYEKTT